MMRRLLIPGATTAVLFCHSLAYSQAGSWPTIQDLSGQWRYEETLEGNVTGWPVRCEAKGILQLTWSDGALTGTLRSEGMQCRNPRRSYREPPSTAQISVQYTAPALSFFLVEGCPYTATVDATNSSFRGTLECTIEDGGEPMRVYGEWHATRDGAPPPRVVESAPQQPTDARSVAVQIIDSTMLPPPSRQALVNAVARALADGFCEDADFSAHPVDLNADTTPEVQVEAVGPCYNSISGGMNWVFIRDPESGAWQENFGFPGGLIALPSRSGGFVDVMVAMAGSETPVWRWNGSAYSLYCRVPALPGGRNSCPGTIPRNPTADGLPSFRAATRPRPSAEQAPRDAQRDLARRLARAAPAGPPGQAAICPDPQRSQVRSPRRCGHDPAPLNILA